MCLEDRNCVNRETPNVVALKEGIEDAVVAKQESSVAKQDVGYEDFWYAALVQTKCERIVAREITVVADNFEVWVASREECHRYRRGGKLVVRKKDVVLLPSYVFFRFPVGTLRPQKYAPLLEVKKLSKVFRLVQSPGHAYGEWEGVHIPDEQIRRLKFILKMSDNPVDVETKRCFVKGDRVKVVRGSLMGLEGVISKDDEGRDRIYVIIDQIGYASTEISRLDVAYISQ